MKEMTHLLIDPPRIEVKKTDLWWLEFIIDLGPNTKEQIKWWWIEVDWLPVEQVNAMREKAIQVDEEKKLIYLPWKDILEDPSYQVLIRNTLEDLIEQSDLWNIFPDGYTLEIVWSSKGVWDESLLKLPSFISRDSDGYAYFSGAYSSEALSAKRADIIHHVAEDLFPDAKNIVSRGVLSKDGVSRKNIIRLQLLPIPDNDFQVIDSHIKHNKFQLPSILDDIIPKETPELMSELGLEEFSFEPIDYKLDFFRVRIFYEGNFYYSNDKRFETKHWKKLDTQGNELFSKIKSRFFFPDGKEYFGEVLSKQEYVKKDKHRTDASPVNSDENVEKDYIYRTTDGDPIDLRDMDITYYYKNGDQQGVEYTGEVNFEKNIIIHKTSWISGRILIGPMASFNEEDVVLEANDSVRRSIYKIAKYLQDNPNELITIFSSASYNGERVEWDVEFKKYFATVLRNRTRIQWSVIKDALVDLHPRFESRILVIGLWDEWAHDEEGNGLWIKTRIVPGKHQDPYKEDEIQLITRNEKKEIVPVKNLHISPYPINLKIEDQKTLIVHTIQKRWLVSFLTEMQVLDWVLDNIDLKRITAGASKFIGVCSAQIEVNLQAKNRKSILALVQEQAPHLKKLGIKNSIRVYTIMKFFQKHVRYNKRGKLGTTFMGMIWFSENSTISSGSPVEMDCDIMTIVAHEILNRSWIDHTFMVQYDEEHVVNHANGQIWETFIERTNFENFWYLTGELRYTPKYTTSEIWSIFLNTYHLPWSMLHIDRIKREWMRYCMDRKNSHNLYATLINFSIFLKNLMTANQEGISSAHLEDIIFIINMMQSLKMYEGKEYNYQILVKHYVATIDKLYKEYQLPKDNEKLKTLWKKSQSLSFEISQ